jgi:hypothetical protein
MNPNLYTGYAGLIADPKTYGSMGQFINPTTYTAIINPITGLVQGLIPAAPVAAVKK